MKLDKLSNLGKWLSQRYQAIEDYFTSGSFGVKFYPLLMYPCVRYSIVGIVRLTAIISIFIALYYFFAEWISLLFSDAFFSGYVHHTVLELLQPAGTIIDNKEIFLSPLYFSMKVAFFFQGCFFLLIYLVGVTQVTARRFRLLGILFSFLFSCGAMLIVNSQGGVYTLGGLQNTGADLTYLCGNLAMFFSGLGIIQAHWRTIRVYSITAGLLGVIAMASTFAIETPYLPLLERLSIYSLLIWEVVLGFTILNKKS